MQSQKYRKHSYLLALLATSFLLFLSTGQVRAQIEDRPKVGPEHKKMEIWVGEWKYEGKLSDTPFGPGGKFTGRQTSRLILDGLFLERSGEDVGVYAGKTVSYKFLGVQWFDSATKVYRDRSFDNDGTASEATSSVSGNTWTYTGTTTTPKGETYKTRTTSTLSADGTTCVQKSEFSMDEGKTWKLFWEDTMKKTAK